MCRSIKTLIKLFNCIFICIPLGLAAILAGIYILGGWEVFSDGFGPDHFGLPVLTHFQYAAVSIGAVLLLCILWIKMIDVCAKKIKKELFKRIVIAFFVFFVAIIVRLPLLYMFREDLVPFSDFQRSWDMAHGIWEGNLDYYSLFPSYLNYSVYQKWVVSLIGDSYMNILYLNVVYSSLTASFIYLIVTEVSDHLRISGLAGILYALYPANIVYTTTGTPEFITIFFNTVSVWLLIYLLKITDRKKSIIIAFMAGIMLGIGDSYKSFAVIILIAFSMSFVAKLIIEKEKVYFGKRQYISLGITMMILISVLFGYQATSRIILSFTENNYGQEINTSASLPHFFLVGLNTEGEGQIHLGTMSRQYYQTYLSNGMNLDEAKKYAYALLKSDWNENIDKIIPLFGKKIVWAWQDDNRPLLYLLEYEGVNIDSATERVVCDYLENILPEVTQIYYLLLMSTAVIGAVCMTKQRNINFIFEFYALIIFGYFCLLMLSEAQSRYKCLIMPYVCILSAIGINRIIKKYTKKRKIK